LTAAHISRVTTTTDDRQTTHRTKYWTQRSVKNKRILLWKRGSY